MIAQHGPPLARSPLSAGFVRQENQAARVEAGSGFNGEVDPVACQCNGGIGEEEGLATFGTCLDLESPHGREAAEKSPEFEEGPNVMSRVQIGLV